MMKTHRFKDKESDGSWIVHCNETGGSFSTILWKQFKVTDQECVCCGGKIENGKKN